MSFSTPSTPNKVSLIFLIVIIAMGSVGLLATDIYIPALPEMAQYFNCTQPEIQASFTVFLLSLAACQLVYGVLCDRFGRKLISILGLSLFVIASLFCAFADSLGVFLFSRIMQAIGGGVGSVVTRAIIANRFNRLDAVKIFSTTFPIIGLSAAIGPFIGGYLTYFFNWRANFFFLALFGMVALCLVVFYLEETKSEKKILLENMEKPGLFTTFRGYKEVIRNPHFLGFAFILCSGFAVFRSYSAESPFVFKSAGFAAEEMGAFYFALSVAYIVGNLCAKKLINQWQVESVLKLGFGFFVFGGLCMLLGSSYVSLTPYAIIAPMAIVVLGNGFLFPTSSASAMTSVATNFSGMASGLLGALQFITAAFCINCVGRICQGDALSMSFFISVIIGIGLLSFVFLASYRSQNIELSKDSVLTED